MNLKLVMVPLLLTVFIAVAVLDRSSAFYLPGVYPKNFAAEESVPLKVSIVRPDWMKQLEKVLLVMPPKASPTHP